MSIASAERIVPVGLPAEAGFGLLHPGVADTGVLIVVGGPQTRVGSHRHFVQLARRLGQAGYPSLRFDHRGVGDSPGPLPDFRQLDADLRAGIDSLMAAQPQLRRVLLWGLCDAASAALLYLARQQDERVAGLCLLNPWVRSAQGQAKVQVQHYYWERLRSRSFWLKLLRGGVGAGALRGWLRARREAKAPATAGFQQLMAQGWHRFPGPRLLQLSGRDHTAREFEAAGELFSAWRDWATHPRLRLCHYPDADHTFSQLDQQAASFDDLLDWLAAQFPSEAGR